MSVIPKPAPTCDAVLAAVAGGSVTVPALVAATGRTRVAVNHAVARLRSRALVSGTSRDGSLALTGAGRAALGGDTASAAKAGRRPTTSHLVLHLVVLGVATVAAMARATGMGEGTLRAAVRSLVVAGRLTRTGFAYRLTGVGAEVLAEYTRTWGPPACPTPRLRAGPPTTWPPPGGAAPRGAVAGRPTGPAGSPPGGLSGGGPLRRARRRGNPGSSPSRSSGSRGSRGPHLPRSSGLSGGLRCAWAPSPAAARPSRPRRRRCCAATPRITACPPTRPPPVTPPRGAEPSPLLPLLLLLLLLRRGSSHDHDNHNRDTGRRGCGDR